MRTSSRVVVAAAAQLEGAEALLDARVEGVLAGGHVLRLQALAEAAIEADLLPRAAEELVEGKTRDLRHQVPECALHRPGPSPDHQAEARDELGVLLDLEGVCADQEAADGIRRHVSAELGLPLLEDRARSDARVAAVVVDLHHHAAVVLHREAGNPARVKVGREGDLQIGGFDPGDGHGPRASFCRWGTVGDQGYSETGAQAIGLHFPKLPGGDSCRISSATTAENGVKAP